MSGLGDGLRVVAIVLAAGRSTRMAPANKLLTLDEDGVCMVSRVVRACLASRAAEVMVVTGHQAAEVEAALRRDLPRGRQIFVHAAEFAQGLSCSLRAGLSALSSQNAAALVCLGDMPLVLAEDMDRIIAGFDPSKGQHVVAPCWQGRRGNPVLWGAKFFAGLANLSGDLGGRGLLAGLEGEVYEIPAASEGVLIDFDTPGAVKARDGGSLARTPG